MTELWLYVLAGLCWINDWPWLLAVVGVSWALHLGQGPATAMLLPVEMIVALVAEAVLAGLLPRVRVGPLAVDTGLEGAALAGFALLWGVVPGVLLWQLLLGADASERAHQLIAVMGRRLMLRTVRFAAVVLFIALQ